MRLAGKDAGHRRLGHKAQQESRQRDAELGTREVQGEVAQQRLHPTGLRVGSFSRRLDPGPVYSHQAELGGHEEGVDGQ